MIRTVEYLTMVVKDLWQEPRCPHCGGTRDRPNMKSDDSYSTFECPFPFHWDSQWALCGNCNREFHCPGKEDYLCPKCRKTLTSSP